MTHEYVIVTVTHEYVIVTVTPEYVIVTGLVLPREVTLR